MSPDSVLWHLPDAPSAERNLPRWRYTTGHPSRASCSTTISCSSALPTNVASGHPGPAASLPVLRLTAKTSGSRAAVSALASRASSSPPIGTSAARMAARMAGQIRQERLSAEGAHAVPGRLLTHNLRPARRRQRTTRGLIVEIPAVKAHCRHTPPGGHRAPAAHADMVMVGSGPGPAIGHPRRSRSCRCRSETRPAQVSPGWKR
jgi:hypothetical protein